MKRLTLFVTLLVSWGILSYATTSVQAQDEPLSDIWVIVTTADGIRDAQTDDTFSIGLLNDRGEVFKGWRQATRSWNENEQGRTEINHYIMERGGFYNHSSFFSNSRVCIRAGGMDAWLISSVFVVGRLQRTGDIVLLAGNPLWQTNRWLSLEQGDRDSAPAYTLNGDRISRNCT